MELIGGIVALLVMFNVLAAALAVAVQFDLIRTRHRYGAAWTLLTIDVVSVLLFILVGTVFQALLQVVCVVGWAAILSVWRWQERHVAAKLIAEARRPRGPSTAEGKGNDHDKG